MKDHTKASVPSSAGDDAKVVELTPDMALPDQAKHKIVNLTQALDDQKSEPPEITVSQPRIQEAAPAPKEEILPEPEKSADSIEIEDDVNVAFDTVQEPAEALHDPADDKLLDDLSNVTEMVDSAIQKAAEPKSSKEDEPVLDDIPAPLETAQEAPDDDLILAPDIDEEELDEAIELADIVDPTELKAVTDIQPDEEILELADIVDQDAATDTQADEEILELTDIVDQDAATDTQADEPILELIDIVDSDAATDTQADEEILELTDIVDSDAATDTQADEEILELIDIVDPAELETIAGGREEDEQLIRLSDVLNRKTKTK